MRISDWSSDVCSSDLVVDALVASAPDTDDGAPTSVSISAPVATLDSIEHVMHQPGACGRIMLSEEAVHAKFVAVAQITPTKCYAGSRSEEHTSELQSLMRISYAVFCLKKKKKVNQTQSIHMQHT